MMLPMASLTGIDPCSSLPAYAQQPSRRFADELRAPIERSPTNAEQYGSTSPSAEESPRRRMCTAKFPNAYASARATSTGDRNTWV